MDPTRAWLEVKQSTDIDFAREYVMKPDPMPLGIPRLDAELGGGIPVSTYTTVAGEPGTGKSALACVAAYYAALNGRFVLYYSFEMPSSMVISRLLSVHTAHRREMEQMAGIPFQAQTKQVWWSSTEHITERNGGRRIQTEAEAAEYMRDHGSSDNVLVAWEDFRRTVWPRIAVMETMESVAWACGHIQLLASSGLGVLPIIDYVQLGAMGEEKEYERLSTASRQLQQTAKQCRIPMIVISSMRNLGREERKEAPTLSMLRGSGNIGYDAGTVIMLQRDREREKGMDEHQLRSNKPVLAHIIKNRVGQSGIGVPLMFNGGMNHFE